MWAKQLRSLFCIDGNPGFQFTGDNIYWKVVLDLFQCYVQGTDISQKRTISFLTI
jgi:hypothetical protein